MFHDGRSIENGKLIEADLCILGAGAAGLTIAQEFTGKNFKVALIESGSLEFEDDTQALYEGEDEDIGLSAKRLRYFGGSTNCWHGRCAPLDKTDFEKRDWVPNSGWPISRDDLVPFYKRACNLLDLGSFDQFNIKDWETKLFPGQFFRKIKSVDSKFLGMPFFRAEEPFLRFGPRFAPPLKQDKNISVYLNSNVVEIETDEQTTVVQNVKIATIEGKQFSVRAKNYVLSLGGIENPRLLLSSNSIARQGIGNNYDCVGRYFMDHSFTDMSQIFYSNEKFCFDTEVMQAPAAELFFKPNEQIQMDEGLLNAGIYLNGISTPSERAFIRFGHDIKRGNISSRLGEQILDMSEDIGGLAHNAACRVQGKRAPYGMWGVMVQAEQPPHRDNRVTLGNSIDALGMRKLKVKREMREIERHSVLRINEMFAMEILRHGLGRVHLNHDYEDGRIFQKGVVDSQFGHDMGTTRMSSNPKEGVVDINCQVHGVSNLYIGGSSVFPTGGFANPTLTIIALALRIADRLKK